MKIRTQLIISMVFFGAALAIISASVITTNQQVERLNKQEELAKNIELNIGELSYLSNNYLLYHEGQQTDRWESKYSSISADISNLTADKPDQLVLVNNLKNSQQRLKEIFGDIASRVKNTSEGQSNAADMAFIQVSGSRIGVQTQGMVFDASRLAQMLNQQAEDEKQQNNFFIFTLVGAFLAFLFSQYFLIYRHTLTSISNLQAGAEVIGSGNLDYSIIEKKDDEISELAKAFNKMTGNLKTVTASKADLEREIVERRRAEMALQESEQRFRGAIDNFPNVLVIYDADRKVRYVNLNGLKIMGLSEQQVVGKKDEEIFPPEMLNSYLPALKLAVERKMPQSLERTRPAKMGGQTIIINIIPLLDGMGEVRQVLGLTYDITERKKAEEEIKSLAKFPEENPNPVLRVTVDGTIAYASPSSAKLLESWSCQIGQVMPEDYRNLVQETLRSGNNREIEATSGNATYSLVLTPIVDKGYVNIYGRDITERKQAEEALQDSEALLRALTDNSPDAIYVKDTESRWVMANPAVLQIIGKTAEEALGKTDLELHADPAIGRAILENDRHLFESGQAESFEEVADTPNGRRTFLSVKAPRRDAAGNIIGLVGISRDITERKKTEEALKGSEKKLAADLDAMTRLQKLSTLFIQRGDFMPVLDEIIDIAIAISGADFGNIQLIDPNSSDLKIVTHRGFPEWWIDYWATVSKGEGSCSNELERRERVIVEDVEQSPIFVGTPGLEVQLKAGVRACQSTPLVSRSGRPLGMFSTHYRSPHRLDDRVLLRLDLLARLAADIIERAQIEDAIQKAHDELELRVQERTAELKQAAERLEMINAKLVDEIKEHAKAKAELQTAKENQESINEELQAEIEEHRRIEDELTAARDAAEEAVRAKAAFLANMSHELRTPLNSIIGFTSILLGEPLSPEYMDWIENMRMNGEALLALINDILDFSKLEKEKIGLELHPFDLRQRIEESLDLVSAKAAEKGLDLAYMIDENVPETIVTDSARLRQVLANLLSNAVKYTDHGEVVLSVSSKPEGIGHELHFAVQDTGIGMPQNQMGKLFQPFSQINTSISRLNEGTGLGLAISKKLIELMGGKIWAESEDGKGSTFHFTIKANAEAQSGGKKLPAGSQPHLAKRSVLIIDDNKTIRMLLARQVQSWGMAPILSSSGSEALEKILKGVIPDAAILDADMPHMDGITLAATIRRYGLDLPLVMLTSIGQHIPQYLSAGTLEKPIKPMQLYDTLTGVLAGRPIREQANEMMSVNRTGISPLRILLAEDNASSQRVTMLMLKKLGYRADLAANGSEVLQALERQPYDVVLMDVRMPEMDGLEAARQIRQRWLDNGPRIIALTAYALQGDKERCLEAGMDDYISKPMQINELAAALGKCPPPIE